MAATVPQPAFPFCCRNVRSHSSAASASSPCAAQGIVFSPCFRPRAALAESTSESSLSRAATASSPSESVCSASGLRAIAPPAPRLSCAAGALFTALSFSSGGGCRLHRSLLISSHGPAARRRPCRGAACSHAANVHLEKGGKRRVQSKLQRAPEQERDLKEWMEENGLKDSKVQLLEREVDGSNRKPIHYVAASEDLQPGDVALSVPFSLVVTLERVLGDETLAELLTTNKLSELACLALYLMYEKKQGKDSFWYPYIRELDRQRGRGQLAVESPLLWTPEELNEYLAGSPMKQVVLERLEGIKREYQELDTVWFMAGSLFKQYPFDIPTEAFSFEIFKQAFVAVQSCVVHLQGVSLARRFCLVPLGPPLLAYQSSSRAMLKSVDGVVQLAVDRAYKAGEPLVVWCGPQPNTRLLLNYGFVDGDNPYDRLLVEASLDTTDPLYQDKRIIVQKKNLSTIQTFQVFKGKEREAVLGMLPYFRLGHVADSAEMRSVSFAQGPTCPSRPCSERAILDQLANYFSKRLAGYRTSVVEDIATVQDVTINAKKRVATQLLRIEKEILGNALSAVTELINELPDGTLSLSPCSGAYVPRLK